MTDTAHLRLPWYMHATFVLLVDLVIPVPPIIRYYFCHSWQVVDRQQYIAGAINHNDDSGHKEISRW